MGAFSFLSTKKTQQAQRSQANSPSQLSPHYAQDSQHTSSTTNLSYHSSSLNSRRSPTPLSSPAHSTVSFFSNSRSTTPRSAYPSDTYSSHQSSFDSVSRAESPCPTPPPKKSRPSLNIIRGATIPRLSLSREDSTGSSVPSANNAKGRSPIYMRFGFSKSSTNLPPEVTTPPATETKITRRRRNTKDSKFDGDSEDGRSLAGSRPPTPSRFVPPLPFLEAVPVSPPAIFTPDSPSVYVLPSSTSFPTISTLQLDDLVPDVPPKDNLPSSGIEVPNDDADLSTSLLLQRRRAKSLGNPRADEKVNPYVRMDPAHRITNLKLPPPSYPPLPTISPTLTGTTLTLPQRASSRSSSPSTSRASTPTTTETTIPVPPTPMTASTSLCSGSSRARSESGCGAPSRTRSESGCSVSSPLPPFARTRSESGSSRARSESNASSVSSRRNSSKTKQRVTMIKMEDLWGEFLKEVDEDMHDLCTTPIRTLQDVHQSLTPTPTKTQREKVSSSPRLPRSGSQNNLVKPLSTTSATFASIPSPKILTPNQRGRGKTIPVSASIGRDEDRGHTQDAPLPHIPPTFVEQQDANSKDVNSDTLDVPSIPSIPSLPSTKITIITPEVSDSASANATNTSDSPKSDGSPSSLPYLYSPDPSASAAESPSMDVNRNSTYSTHSVLSINSTLSFADSSRPDSTCSEFSQFSLSLFPSPPSVPVIRPTTRIGTFRVAAAPTMTEVDTDSKEEGEEAKPLQYKPILARSSDLNKQERQERNEPPSAWSSRRTHLRPKAGISTSRYSSLFLDQGSISSDAESMFPPTPTSLTPSALLTAPTTPVTPTTPTNGETVREEPASKASPTRGSSKKATTPNYDALLRSMDAAIPVASVGGNAGSRPGTADGKFQQWGYAF